MICPNCGTELSEGDDNTLDESLSGLSELEKNVKHCSNAKDYYYPLREEAMDLRSHTGNFIIGSREAS